MIRKLIVVIAATRYSTNCLNYDSSVIIGERTGGHGHAPQAL